MNTPQNLDKPIERSMHTTIVTHTYAGSSAISCYQTFFVTNIQDAGLFFRYGFASVSNIGQFQFQMISSIPLLDNVKRSER